MAEATPQEAPGNEASSAPAADEPMEDRASKKTEGTQPIPTDNGAAPMDTEQPPVVNEPQTEVVKKRRTVKHVVDFQAQHAGLSSKELAVWALSLTAHEQ